MQAGGLVNYLIKIAFYIFFSYLCDVKKIGNILTNSNSSYPEYFNVSNTLDFSNDLPTLIIGFDLTFELYKDKVNANNNKLDDNLYWTFLKSENRSKYEQQLELFITDCILYQVNKSSYIFVDLIHTPPKKLIKIAKKILTLSNPISLVYYDMIYIYGENLIFGVDLSLCQFVGLDSDKIFVKIKSISKEILEYKEIIIEYEDLLFRVDNQVRYLPILYSIENERT